MEPKFKGMYRGHVIKNTQDKCDPPNPARRIGRSSYYIPHFEGWKDIDQLKARKTLYNGNKVSNPVLFGLRNLRAKQCMFLILRHSHLHDVKAEITKGSRH